MVDLRGILAGKVKSSIVRYQPPLPKDLFDGNMFDCWALHLDESLLAFQGTEPAAAGKHDRFDGTSLTIFNFAELGKLRDSSTAGSRDEHGSIELLIQRNQSADP